MTVHFVTVTPAISRSVTMQAAMLLANADVVIGTAAAVDTASSLCGQNAEQISFAPGVASKAFVDELRAVVGRHAHDPETIIVRLIAELEEPSDGELSVVHEVGTGYTVVTGVSSQMANGDSDHLGLPRRGALVGIRVVVPRARHQAGQLSDLLLRDGATPITVPVIDTVDPDDDHTLSDALDHLSDYAWVVFSSQNAVSRTARALSERPVASSIKVAAVGRATAAALEQNGIAVDLFPPRASARSLVELFPTVRDPARVLFPCADIAGDDIEVGLTARGYLVDRVVAYRTVYPPVSPFVRHRAHGAEAIIFSSPSTVTGYPASVGRESCPSMIVTIGPSTTERAKQSDLRVMNEAGDRSLDGVVAALVSGLERPR